VGFLINTLHRAHGGRRWVLDRSPDGWTVYVPDSPGCVSAGVTGEEAEEGTPANVAGTVGA
jgi:hypothetical protein